MDKLERQKEFSRFIDERVRMIKQFNRTDDRYWLHVSELQGAFNVCLRLGFITASQYLIYSELIDNL